MSKQYKKYMKKEVQEENPLLKVFIISFFGMLLVFTFLIKSFSPTVDTTIGDYQAETVTSDDIKNVDGRLEMIQNEDQGRNFSDLVAHPDDIQTDNTKNVEVDVQKEPAQNISETSQTQPQEPVYKVFIGNYTSAEQAKVAKDIIQESGAGFNPIVKCIGSNSYTLQIGIFKNKQSAESLLYTAQQNNLPGRIVKDY